MIELSIIIVSFNTKDLLKKCLDSLYTSLKFSKLTLTSEVIVVDNASTDGSVEMLQTKYSKVVVIKNNKNIGFGSANNLALDKAKGKYILFLNSDTLLFKNSLENSLKVMKKHDDVGVLGCQILNPDLSIQQSYGFYPSLLRVFFWMTFLDDLPCLLIKPYHQKVGRDFYQKEKWVDWVTGAFFLIRNDVVKKAGKFDPKVFMYAEEVEYCYRIKKAGFRILFSPEAKIIHKKGASGQGRDSGIIDEFSGLIYFYQKHFNRFSLMVLKSLLFLGALFRVIVFGIIGNSGDKQKTYLKYLKLA